MPDDVFFLNKEQFIGRNKKMNVHKKGSVWGYFSIQKTYLPASSSGTVTAFRSFTSSKRVS